MGPDPTTGGLLTRRFTVYYGVGDLSTGGLGDIKGIVSVEDPIETFPVRQIHQHTQHIPYKCLHSVPAFQQVDPANFTLEALICPAGYVLRPHATQTGVSVCTCNEDIPDILLCKDDQETVIIEVSL